MNSQPSGRGLAGVTVVVTRAITQAQPITSAIEQLGGLPLALPALEIEACELTDAEIHSLAGDQDAAPVLVFTSPNAVRTACSALRKRGYTLRVDSEIIAIGAGTQAALAAMGLRSQRPVAASSESLAELPSLTEGAGRTLCIIRGHGGRDVLAASLTSRRWMVNEILSYRRVVPQRDLRPQLERWRRAERVICIFMSGETARNLVQMVRPYGESTVTRVRTTPAVVISQRVEQVLISLDWTGSIIVSRGTTVEALMRSAVELGRSG